MYLFVTAFAEELAWRGFLLEQVSFPGESICSILLVGIIWTIWHLPMWIIRNSLGAGQIIPLCIWTLLVSVVLGIAYYQCRNILFIAVLRAAFNICYLAPIAYNTAAAGTAMLRHSVPASSSKSIPPVAAAFPPNMGVPGSLTGCPVGCGASGTISVPA